MEELLPCTLTEVLDGLLHDAILERGVDPAKGKMLSLGAATVLKSIVCELSIVTMVVEDADTMLIGKELEHVLSFHCFFRGELGQKMDVFELGVVVEMTVAAVQHFLVSDPLSWAMKPTCVEMS